MNRLRIALVSHEYPPFTGFGGIGTYTWQHARALVRLGHEVDVIAGAISDSHVGMTMHDGVRVFRNRAHAALRAALAPIELLGSSWTRNRIENAVARFIGFRRRRSLASYDIVEVPECGGDGALIGPLTALPTIVRLHSPARLIMPSYDTSRLDRWACSWVEHAGIASGTAITACSAFLAREAKQHLDVRGNPVVIPNGIDLEDFDNESTADLKDFSLSSHRPMILFTGRMERRKGIHLCPEIVSTILKRHSVSFVFAGEDLFGYVRDHLEPAIRGIPTRGSFTFLGRQPAAIVRALLRRTDMVLLPSTWESCPYACLEAMAAGRPIVASNAGGLPELIADGENGLLAQSENTHQFIDRLEMLIESATLRRRLGEAGRHTVESSFRAIDVAERSVALYRNAAG